jgi:5'-nucleotidase
MKVLVTNDDGIYARGLWELVEELSKANEVVVVAPDREQSAVGTAVTLHQPLRFDEVRPLIEGVKTYAVEGTPADSVILALQTLVKDEIEMVFSGINEGANLGDDVLISGTVGAALQGYFRGLVSVAMSVGLGENMHYEVAARLASLLADKVNNGFINKKMLLNVNLPNLSLNDIAGIELTSLAKRNYADLIIEGHDGKRKYYWIARGEPHWDGESGTDICALVRNMISFTLLRNELSHDCDASFESNLEQDIFNELQS